MANSDALAVDVGSSSLRFGFCGNDNPEISIPSSLIHNNNEIYFGNDIPESIQISEDSVYQNCIKAGIIQDGDSLTKLLQFGFSKLDFNRSEKAAVFTESYHPKEKELEAQWKQSRETLTELYFEMLSGEAFYVFPAAIGSLYASGATSGIVVDVGYEKTETIICYEGYCLPDKYSRCNVGGKQVTELVLTLLKKNDYTALNSCSSVHHQMKMANEIKEKHCTVSPLGSEETKEMVLPDGTKLPAEVLKAPEALFTGHQLLLGTNNFVEALKKTLPTSEETDLDDTLKTLCVNGQSAKTPGFNTRIQQETAAALSQVRKGSTMKPPKLAYADDSAFLGASILGSLSTFGGMWISSGEYLESGAAIVHRKAL